MSTHAAPGPDPGSGSGPALSASLEFTYTVRLRTPLDVGAVRGGRRLVYDVVDGEVTGTRISGEVLPGGGDWMLLDRDGWGQLDVRATLRTHDDALIYLSYRGVAQLSPAVLSAPEGVETTYDDQYFRCTPVLETGAAAYAWVNRTVFVSRGRITRGPGIEYQVFRIH